MTSLKTCYSVAGLTLLSVSLPAAAQDSFLTNPAISAVLDGYYQTEDRPLAEREEGFGLGETEIALSANIDDLFYGKLTTVIESHDGDTEVELEEAFVQTLSLPAGFTIRAGRFLSDVGYLNNQHPHSDSFTDRPIAYRAFLGNHYFDDGVRFNYLAPTETYWLLGAEAFSGDSLRAEDETGERDFETVGVYTFYTKLGGDIGTNSAWQLGLSYLRNENGELSHSDHDDEDDHDHEDEDGHSHSASFTGENTFIADFVYKWAPNGNYKYQNLAISGEYFRVNDFLNEDQEGATDKDYHDGWYLSGVYQWSPSWSAGLRYGEADTQSGHDDHFHEQKLKETEVSLSWHHSHFSTVRLQYTYQDGTNYDDITDDNVVTLQYVMTLGAHGAHQF